MSAVPIVRANKMPAPIITRLARSAPEVRVLSSAGITRPHRSYDPVRLPPNPPPRAVLKPRPPIQTGLPRLPASPFQRAVPITPVDQTGAYVDCFPVRAVFPALRSGRHPHRNFRGLLRLHSRYGPLNRSAAQSSLCHEAPARPVTQPIRSSATRSIDNSLGGIFLHWQHAPSGRTEWLYVGWRDQPQGMAELADPAARSRRFFRLDAALERLSANASSC